MLTALVGMLTARGTAAFAGWHPVGADPEVNLLVGEVASIRGFHVLQLVYLVTGALVVALTPARE
ncbi:hypothetical protein AFL01nite_13670 [Aeromicrobium flavum]|uniref:Uncharacterized protein n=1 Tax=Aeromicrobium flavum TaxID=416568 RepID=A0A512HUF7_9ACTN|nr:hypothetical protein AFL01nite_13670 [Aeromicrobium flavum]